MPAYHGYPQGHKPPARRKAAKLRHHPNVDGIVFSSRVQKMRGSRKGYNADIDDTPARLEEDEVSVAAGGSSVERDHFYSHVVPRRRHKNIRSSIAPDIDLSMVSLLSSKELDRRFLAFESSSSATLPSLGINTDDSSSSGNSQVDYKTIDNQTKHTYPAARPLAVVDYGSIELDMSGSLLDSIYKIDSSGVGIGGSKDLVIGGMRFSFNNESKPKNYDEVCKSQTRASGAVEAAYSATSILNPGAFLAANRRSAEVASVIASLKSVAAVKLSTKTPHLERSEKKQKISNAHVKKSVIVKVPTTLEAAISFSPFARVLFCAQAPYTVLHANAAYGSLVQKGLAKPCLVGEPFSSNERYEGESSEVFISRIVADHMRAFGDEDHGNDEEAPARPRNSLPGFVLIFLVMSSDETYSQFILDYRNDSQRQQMDTPGLCNLDASTHGSSSPVTHRESILNECVSHYLLQIEPSC